MKIKKTRNSLLGITALLGSVFAISTVGYQIADTNRTAIDNALGTKSYEVLKDETESRFKSKYKTVDEVRAAAKEIAIE